MNIKITHFNVKSLLPYELGYEPFVIYVWNNEQKYMKCLGRTNILPLVHKNLFTFATGNRNLNKSRGEFFVSSMKMQMIFFLIRNDGIVWDERVFFFFR